MKNDNTLEKDLSLFRERLQKHLREQIFSEEETAYSYWMDAVPGIGRGTMMKLLYFVGTPRQLYEASAHTVQEWVRRGWMKPAQERAWQAAKQEKSVKEEYRKLQMQGIRCIPCGNPEYPKRLLELTDPPVNLYVRGKCPVEHMPSVGIVGARLCSDYGRYMAKQFGRRLAQAGIQVISGMAAGVDGISQQAAVDAGGASFGILGCGVDICYPEQNQALYEALIHTGGVLSEYPPGTLPKAGLFPERNRIISGCADLVLVIEAREKSGTLITVDAALEQGREVYALPGRVTDTLAAGCNSLICQGAGIALSPEYVADAVWKIWKNKYGDGRTCRRNSEKGEDSTQKIAGRSGLELLSQRERLLLSQLSEQGKSVDELYTFLHEKDSYWTAAVISSTLMQLCVGKYVYMCNGRFYKEEESMGTACFSGRTNS